MEAGRPVSNGEFMIITLTPEIEQALTEEARRLGTTPESLALESLFQRFIVHVSDGTQTDGGRTLADSLGRNLSTSVRHVGGDFSESPPRSRWAAAG